MECQSPNSLQDTWSEPGEAGQGPDVAGHVEGKLGRYQLLAPIGAGAMGEVFRAYDPQLEREVAIKRLSFDRRESAAARLLREAKTIARLSHPNIVQVHDAGQDEATQGLFIAMELIDGQTLRRWLRERTRSWREIVDLFIQAGHGLAAAHERGIVHRDFKPENVLVTRGGQAKVVDFGLAKPTGTSQDGQQGTAIDPKCLEALRDTAPPAVDPEPSETPRSPRTDEKLQKYQTPPGSSLGTPAYMPPEQITGNDSDPRGDQFSFGVALYEALTGRLPFSGKTLTDYALSVLDGTPAPFSRGSEVPGRIQDAVLRTLSVRAQERFDSMTVLLQTLAYDPAARRKRVVAWLGSAAVGGLGVATLWGVSSSGSEPDACDDVAAVMDDVWNDARREQIHGALSAVDLPYARDTAALAVDRLDHTATRWSDARRLLCRQARASATPTFDRAQLCLTRALERHRGLLDVLERAEPSTVARALDAIDNLHAVVDQCHEPAYLAELPSASENAKLEPITRAVAEAELHNDFGRARSGLETLDAIPTAPTMAHWPAALVLEHSVLRCNLLQQDLQLEAALEVLERGAKLALGAEAPLAAARWHHTYGSTLYELDRTDEMAAAYERGHALRLRELGPDHIDTIMARATMGHVPYAAGDYARALEIYDEAAKEAEPLAPADDRIRLELDGWRADTMIRIGRYEQGLALGEDIVRRWFRARGQRHPDALAALESLGSMRLRAGDAPGALEDYRRVIELAGDSIESASFRAVIMANMGAALVDLERPGEASDALLQARRTLIEAGLTPTHPKVLAIDANRATILDDSGEHEAAAQLLEHIVDDMRRSRQLATTNGVMMRFNLGGALLHTKRFSRAMRVLEEALADAERIGDPSLQGRILVRMAKVEDGRRRPARADVFLDQARRVLTELPDEHTWRHHAEEYVERRAAAP